MSPRAPLAKIARRASTLNGLVPPTASTAHRASSRAPRTPCAKFALLVSGPPAPLVLCGAWTSQLRHRPHTRLLCPPHPRQRTRQRYLQMLQAISQPLSRLRPRPLSRLTSRPLHPRLPPPALQRTRVYLVSTATAPRACSARRALFLACTTQEVASLAPMAHSLWLPPQHAQIALLASSTFPAVKRAQIARRVPTRLGLAKLTASSARRVSTRISLGTRLAMNALPVNGPKA